MAREFVPVKLIGRKGAGNGKFHFPFNVAVNAEQNEIAVTDTSNYRIQFFDKDFNYLRQFGQKGSAQGMFNGPTGVIYDKYGDIVVSDNENHSVSVFTKHGKFLRYIATEGNQNGQVSHPLCLSLSDEGNVIVTDSGNKRVQVFTPDGRFVLKLGDTGNARLQDPTGCVYHKEQYLVTDFKGGCIKLFDSRGHFIKILTLQGNERRPVTQINACAITHTNCEEVIVTDCWRQRLLWFKLDGSVISTVGEFGSNLGQFSAPTGVSILGDRQIIVCDSGNHRLQIFNHS